MVQDICFTQIVKILILRVLAIIGLQPQLRMIKDVISDTAISLLQDVSKPQEDIRVVQYFSPACRAARSTSLFNLPSASLLRRMNDLDVEKCREKRMVAVGAVTFLLVVIPAVLALVTTSYITQMMDVLLYTLFSVFMLTTGVVYLISAQTVLIILCSVAGAVVYYYSIFAPGLRRYRWRMTSRIGHRRTTKQSFNTRNGISGTGTEKGDGKNMGVGMRKKRNFYDHLLVLKNDLVWVVDYIHACISISNHRRRVIARRNALDNEWRLMNVHLLFSNGDDNVNYNILPSRFHKLRTEQSQMFPIGRKDEIYIFPENILKMRPTGQTIRVDEGKVGYALKMYHVISCNEKLGIYNDSEI